MSTKPLCRHCKSPDLQICYPTWYRFDDLDGPLDETTFVDVDAEANATVFCDGCQRHTEAKEYYAYDITPEPLDATTR